MTSTTGGNYGLHNLPVQLTSFIGREREIAEVKDLLATTRLLTLTGAGGVGKTRLALQVGRAVLEEYKDGIWWVELAALSDLALVPHAVASRLRVSERPGRPLLEDLADQLRPQSILLLLDNCEHLAAACAQVAATLLQACPMLRILATSREPLGIPGEVIWRVPSLSVPDLQRVPAIERLAQSESVRLFTERAAASRPGFVLTPGNGPAVAKVCVRLDGVPLALELAAVRTRVLTVEEIAARLNDRFRLLAGGSRTELPRHQTLRAAMDWSYDLLSEPEQMLFRRLSIFAGRFTLEAAEMVCARGPIQERAVLDFLTQLVDKSLVSGETLGGREARYRMLETVRQYGAEKLAASGELGLMRERHRDWCLALAERAEALLQGPEQEVWLARLVDELDNLRAALDWCRSADGDPTVGLRIAGALGFFWDVRGQLGEGRQWLEEMLAKGLGAPRAARARAMNWAAVLAYRQGDYERVRILCEEALVLSRALGQKWDEGQALHYLGHVAQSQGDHDRAAALLQESVDLFRTAGESWGLSMSLNCLGDVARGQGVYSRAAALLEEAIGLHREIKNRWGLAMSLHNLAYVMQHMGEPKRAGPLFLESLAHARSLGARGVMGYGVAGLAAVAASEGKLRRAATLFGAADAVFRGIGGSLEPTDREDYERNLARVRRGLDAEALSTAWAAGQAMSLDEAVDFALSAVEPSTPLPETGKAPRSLLLTAREQEVAGLIARGLSNREIAAAMWVAERTAETHIQNILNKLGFNSRAQIAAWAVEQGLHTASQA